VKAKVNKWTVLFGS